MDNGVKRFMVERWINGRLLISYAPTLEEAQRLDSEAESKAEEIRLNQIEMAETILAEDKWSPEQKRMAQKLLDAVKD